MFSRTTIELSTTIPTANAIPARLTTFSVRPNTCIMRNTPTTLIGIAAPFVPVYVVKLGVLVFLGGSFFYGISVAWVTVFLALPAAGLGVLVLGTPVTPAARVVAVAPGPVRTEMLEHSARQVAGNLEDGLATYAQGVPLKRLAAPEEIADLIVFVASSRAGNITGTVAVPVGE